jgi:hypothetical protein
MKYLSFTFGILAAIYLFGSLHSLIFPITEIKFSQGIPYESPNYTLPVVLLVAGLIFTIFFIATQKRLTSKQSAI